MPVYRSVRKVLENNPIEASAPCRIDSGGTWDIKAMALPLEKVEPVTVNMALSMRTKIELTSFRDGWVKITSEGFRDKEERILENAPFNSPFGLFFAAVSHFGFHGLKIHIRSDAPVKSALGGSSTALVALIKALSKLVRGEKSISSADILRLGYHLEDGISGGNCGLQDQAAAVYGGVNRWKWTYGKESGLTERESLLDVNGMKDLSSRILVAYSGKSHISAKINRFWINDFLSGKTREGWVEVNNVVKDFADALSGRQWGTATTLLREEMALRRKITPDALIPVTEKLIDQAEKSGCGARFTGAGAGGSVWALGEPEKIVYLRKTWEKTMSDVKGSRILDCVIDHAGVS